MDYLNKITLNLNEINDIQRFSAIFYVIFGFLFICIILLYMRKNSSKNKNKYSV
jgi:hypothetical protein